MPSPKEDKASAHSFCKRWGLFLSCSHERLGMCGTNNHQGVWAQCITKQAPGRASSLGIPGHTLVLEQQSVSSDLPEPGESHF